MIISQYDSKMGIVPLIIFSCLIPILILIQWFSTRVMPSFPTCSLAALAQWSFDLTPSCSICQGTLFPEPWFGTWGPTWLIWIQMTWLFRTVRWDFGAMGIGDCVELLTTKYRLFQGQRCMVTGESRDGRRWLVETGEQISKDREGVRNSFGESPVVLVPCWDQLRMYDRCAWTSNLFACLNLCWSLIA